MSDVLPSRDLYVGQFARLRFTFQDYNGRTVAPDTIVLEVSSPSAVVTVYAKSDMAEETDQGYSRWYKDIPVNDNGNWTYFALARTPGSLSHADGGTFHVEAQPI